MAYGKLGADFIETSTRTVEIDNVLDSIEDLEKAVSGSIASFARLNPDSNNIFTVIEYYRPDGTLIRRSSLSGGTSPQYTTRTIQFFDEGGTAVIQTRTFALSYSDNELVSELEVTLPTP